MQGHANESDNGLYDLLSRTTDSSIATGMGSNHVLKRRQLVRFWQSTMTVQLVDISAGRLPSHASERTSGGRACGGMLRHTSELATYVSDMVRGGKIMSCCPFDLFTLLK